MYILNSSTSCHSSQNSSLTCSESDNVEVCLRRKMVEKKKNYLLSILQWLSLNGDEE